MITLTPELRDRVARERQAQGLPATVEDAVVLARVATLLASSPRDPFNRKANDDD